MKNKNIRWLIRKIEKRLLNEKLDANTFNSLQDKIINLKNKLKRHHKSESV
jgi:hypothetical protein